MTAPSDWTRFPDYIERGDWQIWKVRTTPPTYTLWLKVGKKYVHQGNFDSADKAKEKTNGTPPKTGNAEAVSAPRM